MNLARRFLGMRWWLAFAFAAVAAITAVAVVAVLGQRSERAFRSYAEVFAVGSVVASSETLKHAHTDAALQRSLSRVATHRRVALFAFDSHGRLLTGERSQGIAFTQVPGGRAAIRKVLANDRYIEGARDGSAIVVGIPIHSGAGSVLVAYALRPELKTQLGIVRGEFPQAALIALLVGASIGLLIASLIARRLARIAGAAQAIGRGDFAARAPDNFPDEVGSLAASIERMRGQLEHLVGTLQGDRDRLERLLSRLHEGVLLVDGGLRVQFSNERASALLSVGEIRVGATLAEAGAPAALVNFAAEIFGSAPPRALILTPDDDHVLRVDGIPPASSGDPAIIVIADESQRERSDRAQRDFATNASHELRTPLASLVTAVEMLQTGAKDDPVARDAFLTLIEREAGRLTRLTRALLVLARASSRQEPAKLSRVGVDALLEQVAHALPSRTDVTVTLECSEQLTVMADPDLLEQALSSIAANAVEHTTAGSVGFRAFTDTTGRAVIEVSDTGKGMTSREQKRIFDRFYRGRGAAPGGFGLGLAIANEAVRAIGGEIDLTSRPGEGTTVRIVLQQANGRRT